jgi:hypothetical protein
MTNTHRMCSYVHGLTFVKFSSSIQVTGIFRAIPVRINAKTRHVRSVYRTFIDVIHFRRQKTLTTQCGQEDHASNDDEESMSAACFFVSDICRCHSLARFHRHSMLSFLFSMIRHDQFGEILQRTSSTISTFIRTFGYLRSIIECYR